jgi:DNA polymerase-3 subunit alpha
MMESSFFHTHLHSQFSTLDGMSPVENIAERIARHNQPGFALTDHGTMSGTVKAYKAAKAHDLKFFPGIEQYIIDPKIDLAGLAEADKVERYHLGMFAFDLKGYQGLTKLSTLSFSRPRYSRFPRLLVDDLVEFGQEYGPHIGVTTGCVFGLLEKTLIEEGQAAAEGILRMLQQVTPNLYVEVQKHNIPDSHHEYSSESDLITTTLRLADRFGLPVLATGDCHYLEQKHKSAHNMMKKVGYNSEDGNDEFPGDTYHVSSTGWMREKWDPSIWNRFEESYADILSKHALIIPQLDTFKADVPEVSKAPNPELRKLCRDRLNQEGLLEDEAYLSRLDHELDVIQHTETANYFLLVQRCVRYAQSKNIPIEARGSAAGSLVCYLLGITQIDPLVWGTIFERFMSKDRIGMPDVDIDISDVDRHIILDYLSKLEVNGVKYKTSQIGTYNNLGQNKDDPNDTGSAFKKYMTYLRGVFKDRAWENEKKRAEEEGRKPVKYQAEEQGAIDFNSAPEQKIKTLSDVMEIRPKDYQALKEIIEMNSVYQSKGTHAGGILISGANIDINEFVPLMMIPSGQKETWVTQYTMKDVEQFGLLKMDWLGQTSLTVMRKCQEFLGRDNPLDFTWIPFDDPAVIKYVSVRSNHPGLFHLEQFPKSIAMKELKPKTTEDFVIWQAYSMPGATDSGAKDIYLERRNGKVSDYGYNHEVLKEAFDGTNGVMLFQEQVLEVCRGVGMTGEELTSFFKIIKDSGAGATERNKKRLEESFPRFQQLATEVGFTDAEINWVWKQMVAMGGYAFNRAHAASYGIRSYRTAYLKKHHPVEYMAALLYCWAGSSAKTKHRNKKTGRQEQVSKEKVYWEEAERMNVPILPIKINKSDDNWQVEQIGNRKAMRPGYLSLKGVGEKAAQSIAANQPYSDIVDFVERSGVSGTQDFKKVFDKTGEAPTVFKGVLKILSDSNVLDFD